MALTQRLARLVNDVLHPVQMLPPAEAYRLWAPTYDNRGDNAILFLEEQAVVPILETTALKGKSVIDLGCGTGRHIRDLSQRGAARIVGLDFSGEMLAVARKNLGKSRIWLTQASVESIPFSSARFDVGIAAFVLSHIKNLTGAVREIGRVMRPNATVIVADLHWSFDRRGWKRTFSVGTSEPSHYAVEHVTHELAEYERTFEQAGLSIEKCLQPVINTSLRPFFEKNGMIRTYLRYLGEPLLVVFQLRKP